MAIKVCEEAKIKSVMITGDDARWTVSLPDRYAILPSLIEWRRDPVVHANSRPVAEDFVYASNTNDDWLKPEELQALVRDRIESDR